MPKYTMDEYIDLLLFNKKPDRKKKIKESVIDIKSIMEQDEEVPPAETAKDIKNEPEKEIASDKTKEDVPEPDETEKEDIVKKTIRQSRQTLQQHKPKGDLVMDITMSLQNQEIGKFEVGTDEYATITNFNIIFNKFGLNFKELPDTIKSFSLTTEEKVSQSYRHNVSIMVEMIDAETYGIQLFIDEIGIVFDKLEDAIKEFDKQYGINIIDAINKKVRI